ncbi:UNKNOWN [Stylonychia lemnae]|uniref:FCP1 homology domain-containing protein n=1 Tax=Stylonychia lemnae TaxID=5949 RepID=A0A078B0T2_STYLE|nr:UNKNOWN [Stylonychia lemnae]|eukprot:CDW87896.1 UNKNOWN [Stylonychia lemnae]
MNGSKTRINQEPVEYYVQDCNDTNPLESEFFLRTLGCGDREQIEPSTLTGSGIPMIDINEEHEDGIFSSDEDSQGDVDYFYQVKSSNFSQLINQQVQDTEQQKVEKRQSFNDEQLNGSLKKIQIDEVINSIENNDLNSEDLVKQESMYFLQNDNQAQGDDLFFLEKELVDAKAEKEGTPRFGDQTKFKNLKFVFRNEQQRQKFLKDYEQAQNIWYQLQDTRKCQSYIKKSKICRYLYENLGPLQLQSPSTKQSNDDFESTQESVVNRQTIVICDLHKLLIYIRKSSHTNQDILIKTKSNGISVKFFVSVRRGTIQALLKLRQKFDVVIYSSLDKEMGDAIIDHLEQELAGGKKLFDQRFHSQDSDSITCKQLGFVEHKQKSLELIILSQHSQALQFQQSTFKTNPQNYAFNSFQLQQYRSERNVILVSQNLKDVVSQMQNVIPIKQYDGKKSKNSTIMNLVLYLYKRLLGVPDVREIIKTDFHSLTNKLQINQ